MRLKGRCCNSVRLRCLCFNSKLVRLKGTELVLLTYAGSKFQFQTGAIKRKSLKTSEATTHRFNSKLVRLKVSIRSHALSRNARFNSKLVRLKGNCAHRISCAILTFQFQTGAIKRCDHVLFSTSPIRRFNSKLVRLKAKSPEEDFGPLESFNSKLVRLKEAASP